MQPLLPNDFSLLLSFWQKLIDIFERIFLHTNTNLIKIHDMTVDMSHTNYTCICLLN